MKKITLPVLFCRIMLVVTWMIVSGITANAQQSSLVKTDTSKNKVIQKPAGSADKTKEVEQGKDNNNKDITKAKNNAGGTGPIKQVKGTQPDMSKSSGSKPNIVRPAGSGSPKGKGIPGGAPAKMDKK
jgi:hypothetical protein